MTWPRVTQDVEQWLFMFHLSIMSNDKERAQEIMLAPTQYERI
jgi:hypothetical protein